MLFKSSLRNLLPLVGAIALAGAAQAEDTVAPAIPGVIAANTKVTLIKEGFNGTEGPIGLTDGSLLFTETQANRIVRISTENNVSTFLENTNGANGLGFNAAGELIAVQTLKPKVGIIYPAAKEKVFAENYEGQAFQRPNDLVVDKQGGVYFTDSGTRPSKENPTPPASTPGVYYITAAGKLVRLANDIERPNGIQLSKDEKTLYVANTQGEYILSYDVTGEGKVGEKKNFAKLKGWTNGEGGWSSGADGLATDDNGRLYVASNAGIEVFSDKGEGLGVIPLPKKPQNIAFAGEDKKTLYAVGRGAAYKIETLATGIKGRLK
ncbi:SMP-30/gluconolactonase/LRE family protein [Methylococcus sp. EFPC2]|uniref:SMP-30/gluconolactonase/LRE family protein n=1 Tax=Methylococcus sp. EFPC2 TaxID=2812648 RepID=UPI001966EDD0|nr:SMP-30/gluconolactonase/LRE family protein [Methylococcus sp. EFPC2]QSA98262.1 SMP-30/gluconolactonase/LRE family protein [Methylococcus sp. EFPC2]